jgi:hypothetical protein
MFRQRASRLRPWLVKRYQNPGGFQCYKFQYLDLLVKPFDFTVEYARAQHLELREGLSVPIVGLEALLTMKREAARPQDLADIDALLEVADHGR